MRNKKIRMITFDAMLIAIIAIMTFVPQFGFILINANLAITLIPLPVLIGAYIGGVKRGGIYGFTFGVMSYLRALTASGNDALFFTNPIIAIVPRLVFGLIAGLTFDLVLPRVTKARTKTMLLGLLSFGSTLLHGILTLSTAGFFFPQVWPILLITLVSNTLVEAVVTGILVPMIIAGLNVVLLKEDLYGLFHQKRHPHNEIINE